ncbi:tyrosine-type recombinase/integrase [Peribacillus sp. NPDC060253]|uniref:tyrosine-type recombinase/integrase n=1 Tax=Peribacillus sp. NPDC060253 TaxID=3347084 RepID=UPI00364EC89B
MAYVEKRGKDSFRLVVPFGLDAEGNRIRKTKTIKCKNKTEANKELAKFVAEIETRQYFAPQKMTFSQFVEEWKDKYAKKQLGATTYETYLTFLNKRILPKFGHLKIDKINTLQILDFLDKLQEDGARGDGKPGALSSATVEKHHRIFRNIFKRAVEWKVIKESPAENVKKPKVQSREGRVFTEEQVRKLMNHLSREDMKWKVIVTLAISTGMRRGEIAGLEWDHIDLEKGKINIQQTLAYTKEQGYIFKEPKTRNSIRTVTLSQSVIEQLKRYKTMKIRQKLRAGDSWEGGSRFLLFSSDMGKQMDPKSITRWWNKRLKKYELPVITFHELRHTSATLLINQGVHMKTISARLGHSKIGTTMDLYGHALESADEKAAEHFDNLFKNKEIK